MARISYSLGSLLSVGDVARCAGVLAERGEPDTVWIPETWGAEGFAMLGMLSQRLSSCRLGTSVVNAYSRSPALVAMGAATVDAVSGGRMVLGLGAGSRAIVEGLHGGRFDRPLARVREYVEVVRKAAAGGRLEHSGPAFRLGGFTPMVRPAGGRIPIYLAAVGRGMARLAWEVADGVIFYLRPPAEMKRTVSELRRESGRGIDVACQIITAVSADGGAARERARATLAFYVAVGEAYRGFLAASGYRDEAARIRAAYLAGGAAAAAAEATDRMLDDLTICGTPGECAGKLAEFREAGVDLPVVQFNPVGPAAESFREAVGALGTGGGRA